jgi:hypothetical protein
MIFLLAETPSQLRYAVSALKSLSRINFMTGKAQCPAAAISIRRR